MRFKALISIFLGLTLVIASVAGLAAQNTPPAPSDNANFDLEMLIKQVSQSRSLGLLTKLSLKKDVDRLLKNFGDYHAGAGDSTLEQLHERYNVMVHKLMLLLQDKDMELAKSIEDARDTLWMTLSTDTLAVSAQPDNIETNVEPAHDLRSVIILAGYPCTTVAGFLQPTPTVYQVSCDTDRRYQIHVDEEKTILVDHWFSSVAESPDVMTHDEEMKKHFAAIVNLAGHDCVGIVSYENHEQGRSSVICEDRSVYRIQVTPESGVEVEKQSPGDKAARLNQINSNRDAARQYGIARLREREYL